MIVDAHVRIGAGREVSLTVSELLAQMDALGIDRALVAPAERYIAYDNREGNALTAAIRCERLLPYAVATPWRDDAVDVLARARDEGAVALAVDSALQGFDLLDGLVDPLVEYAGTQGWPVYVRTGTPPNALPLAAAELAVRHPGVAFIMGKSGATDFWIDAGEALKRAQNLYADTAYAPWDTVLSGFPPDRAVFSTDSPYTVAAAELARVRAWGAEAVLGGNLLKLLARED